MNIIIIGGGISGLISACNLQKKGYNTIIIEKNDYLGGRLNDFYIEKNNKKYKFTNGPSWYWMDDIFQETWGYLGIEKKNIYKLKKLNNQYKIILENSEIIVPNDLNEIYNTFNNIDKNSDKILKKYIKENEEKYNLSKNVFMKFLNISIFEYFNINLIKFIFKYNIFESYHSYYKKYFRNTILQKILEWPSYFIGSNPKNTNSIFNVLTYSYLKNGTHIPENGMYSIIEMLEKHYISLGGKIKLNSEIIDVDIEKNRIRKLHYINEKKKYEIECDYIISNCDYYFFEKILPIKYRTYTENYWNKLKTCPSCLIFHLGLDNNFKSDIEFHNLYFDLSDLELKNYLNNFNITNKVPFYLNYNQQENTFFILIPVNTKIYNELEINKCYKNIINRIESNYNLDIKKKIVLKNIFYNQDYFKKYNSFKFNAYGISCENYQFGIFRPSIKSLNINNLYYTGQTTNPGPGLPPCCISGIIVSDLVDKNIKNDNIFREYWNYINHWFIIKLSELILLLFYK